MSAGGLERLRERAARVPALVREVLEAPAPELAFAVATTRRILITGVGSSEAHARHLASLLAEDLALPARFVATGAVGRDAGGDDAVLIVFSQGLSPNGCLPLADAARWRRVVLVTAVGDDAALPERRERLREAHAAGVRVIALPAELGAESGSLLRVAGPVAAHAAALQLARAVATQLGAEVSEQQVSPAHVAAVLETADRRAARVFPTDAPLDFAARPPTLLAAGGYAERCANLAAKLQEGLLVPRPGLWDVVDFVHGPFQQLYAARPRFVFLARADARGRFELRSQRVSQRRGCRVA